MKNDIHKVLIVGAGTAGEELLTEVRVHWGGRYEVAGFIDDDRSKLTQNIQGVPVVGSISNLAKCIKVHSVSGIFIAIPSAEGKTIRRILQACQHEKVFFKMVPRTLEMVQGSVHIEKLRDLKVEDLFGQAIVKSEQPIFSEEFKNRSIMVMGAAGSIGSEVCRQLIHFSPKKLVAVDWSENGIFELNSELNELVKGVDVTYVIGNMQDKKRMQNLIRETRPEIIFHAAAFKHVPLMEDNPLEAIRNNVFGTENLAKIAYEEGVDRFVYVSTDKAADPVNVMGATKLVGEQILASMNDLGRTKYCTVRFGNVLESNGSVATVFKKQIASGGPVTVTDTKMTRFMMTIQEAVQLMLHASVIGRGGEIFILDMGEQIRIDDFARFMIQLAGYVPDKDIKIKYTGVRPGEKISEQLVAEDEYLEKTGHRRIFRVSRHTQEIDVYNLAKLKRAVEDSDLGGALSILKKTAPNLQNDLQKVDRVGNCIPFARCIIQKEEIEAIDRVLESGWLTMGNETLCFEQEFAEYVRAKYAIAVNSCTSALFLSLKALGIKSGDEVIVPAFTFPATVSVVVHCGAVPVFADINKENFTISQESIDKVRTKKTRAIVAVHYGGNRATIKTDLPIIEDSAHFIPKGGDNSASFTRCYSFYATKNMTTGEGGMITTNDEGVAEWLRKARLHGLSRDAWKRYEVKAKWAYEVEFPGWKFNTTDIAASLGREQLKKLDVFEGRRREVVELYNKLLGLKNRGTHLYPILVEERQGFFEYMKKHEVGCSFHFLALHKEPAFEEFSQGKLPITEHVAERVVTLPLDATITDAEVMRVADLVNRFFKKQ